MKFKVTDRELVKVISPSGQVYVTVYMFGGYVKAISR